MKQFSFKKIKEIREEIGMSKAELARRSGFSPQQIWNWENSDGSDKSLTVANLVKIASALKVSPNDFLVDQ